MDEAEAVVDVGLDLVRRGPADQVGRRVEVAQHRPRPADVVLLLAQQLQHLIDAHHAPPADRRTAPDR
jgi:hypothetical protein